MVRTVSTLRIAVAVVIATTFVTCAHQRTAPRAREPRSGFLTGAGGVRLHYLDFGGRGDPLVLLAGAGNTAWIYFEFGQQLATTHHVFALTRRGFGDSDAPSAGYDRATLAADLLALLDMQHLDRAVLVGHSMAGEELTYFAGKHPERVRALIYLDAISDRSQQDAALGDVPAFQMLMPTPADRASIEAWIAFKRRQDRNLARFWTEAVERDARAGREGRKVVACSWHVGDVARPLLVLAGVDDGQRRARRGGERACVTGLTAAQRIEHGSVQHDASLVHRHHRGFAAEQCGVFAEQFVSHRFRHCEG